MIAFHFQNKPGRRDSGACGRKMGGGCGRMTAGGRREPHDMMGYGKACGMRDHDGMLGSHGKESRAQLRRWQTPPAKSIT